MRWQRGRRSANVEDRRGGRPAVSRGAVAGGLGGGGLIVVLLLALVFGVDPSLLLQEAGYDGRAPSSATSAPASPAEEEGKAFVSAVLADTEDAWHGVFERAGGRYEEPRLVLFSGAVESACGLAGAAVGPFYCPADRRVYLDLAFFADLEANFDAPGDFARAYVIAHEVGHHVQTLLGVSRRVREARAGADPAEANALSVRLELQADCLAGVWAHTAAARGLLEAGDVEEGLSAASAVGDDRIQLRSRGYIVPDAFTHGSSEQRARWFRAGLEAGDPEACDTFAGADVP